MKGKQDHFRGIFRKITVVVVWMRKIERSINCNIILFKMKRKYNMHWQVGGRERWQTCIVGQLGFFTWKFVDCVCPRLHCNLMIISVIRSSKMDNQNYLLQIFIFEAHGLKLWSPKHHEICSICNSWWAHPMKLFTIHIGGCKSIFSIATDFNLMIRTGNICFLMLKSESKHPRETIPWLLLKNIEIR